ncbi:hypothetical protein OG612_41680 [Streptomyces sp. NBC_01527]|uniref:hypothetical protein n=1 Tax=unclassified Streptomyces TaxID=2593676 RepID=UPI002E161F09|nr:hypothetical protein OG763_01090 [Streptomyces sp. NBC_01230]
MSHFTTLSTVAKRARLGRRTAAALLGAAALTGLTTVTAPSAGAVEAPSSGWDHTYSGRGVRVYVEEHGDIISVCDTSTNGHSAWVTVDDLTQNRSGYKVTASGGRGSCATRRASDGIKYNPDEGMRIGLNYEGEGGNGSYAVTFVNDH